MANKHLNRRDFVRLGLAGGGAALASASSAETIKPAEKSPEPKILYRTLGRTKLKVSEVCFGSFGFSASDVFNAALDAGINFVQTCADYEQGNAERAFGKILQKRRKEAVIMSGWTLRRDATKAQILDQLDRSLERLQVKDVDIMLAHMCGTVEQVQNPGLHEAFDEAKKAKKVSFLACSTHGGEMDKIFDYAMDSGKFDVISFKYNFMEGGPLEPAIKKAAEKKLGLVAFKVTAGSREKELADYEKKGLTHEKATVRWVLKNSAIASVIRPFSTFEDVKRAVETISKKFGLAEAAMLEWYEQAFSRSYCRYCGKCDDLCPYGVAISEIMRYAMYFKYYGRERNSMELYAALAPGVRAEPCTGCPGHCEHGCPYGVKVRSQLVEAHELLTLMA